MCVNRIIKKIKKIKMISERYMQAAAPLRPEMQ